MRILGLMVIVATLTQGCGAMMQRRLQTAADYSVVVVNLVDTALVDYIQEEADRRVSSIDTSVCAQPLRRVVYNDCVEGLVNRALRPLYHVLAALEVVQTVAIAARVEPTACRVYHVAQALRVLQDVLVATDVEVPAGVLKSINMGVEVAHSLGGCHEQDTDYTACYTQDSPADTKNQRG